MPVSHFKSNKNAENFIFTFIYFDLSDGLVELPEFTESLARFAPLISARGSIAARITSGAPSAATTIPCELLAIHSAAKAPQTVMPGAFAT